MQYLFFFPSAIQKFKSVNKKSIGQFKTVFKTLNTRKKFVNEPFREEMAIATHRYRLRA